MCIVKPFQCTSSSREGAQASSWGSCPGGSHWNVETDSDCHLLLGHTIAAPAAAAKLLWGSQPLPAKHQTPQAPRPQGPRPLPLPPLPQTPSLLSRADLRGRRSALASPLDRGASTGAPPLGRAATVVCLLAWPARRFLSWEPDPCVGTSDGNAPGPYLQSFPPPFSHSHIPCLSARGQAHYAQSGSPVSHRRP